MDDLTRLRLRNVLSCILEGVVRKGDENPSNQPVTLFTALSVPSISIRNYMERLYKYSKCSVECFVLAIIYIDRLIQSGRIQVNSLTIHRVLLTSVVLAAKTYDDHFYTNSHYARVGGVPVEELNSLEIEFLFNIDFSLYVSVEDYQGYFQEIYKHAMSNMCSCCYGMDLPSLSLLQNGNDSSSLVYSKFPGARNVSPTNVNFNAEMDY